MAKTRRTWIPLDVNFTREDKVLEAGWPAARLYLAALGHLYGTGAADGRLTRKVVSTLGVSGWENLAGRLIKAGLWADPDPDTFQVVAWDEWNEVSPEARRQREYRARLRNRPS